jgi:transcriptional regulator with XRE-family HTH domain
MAKRRVTKRARGPDAHDIEIGHRVRVLRLERDISQEILADRLGVTFQQVQKYEKGVNRISCGRLIQIATALDVPVIKFFEGLAGGKDDTPILNMMQRTDTFKLVTAFTQLTPALRARALGVINALTEKG